MKFQCISYICSYQTFIKTKRNLNQNTLGGKEQPSTINLGLVEKDMKSLLSLKVLVTMASLLILDAQGLLLMGSKCLIKMTRPQNILKFLSLVIFIKHFYPINIRRT